jgi:hypothetical protein
MSEWTEIYRNKDWWMRMGTGERGVDVSYRSIYVDVDGEMIKMRQLCLGPFKIRIEGSAWDFGKRVTHMVGNQAIAEAIFGTNGANPDERCDMLDGMMDALGGDEPVSEKVTVMSRNGKND